MRPGRGVRNGVNPEREVRLLGSGKEKIALSDGAGGHSLRPINPNRALFLLGLMTARKHFSLAFKLEIAKRLVEENYSIKQACETSGAGITAVRRWKQQYLAERAGKPLPNMQTLTPDQRETQQLKLGIKLLETEEEILKKSAPSLPRS